MLATGPLRMHGPDQDRRPAAHVQQNFGRISDLGKVASAALFLASAEARFVIGSNLMVDGGWIAA
jgi:NAD(P)-dependent dehydrogenase (short-subunit alcohol dehydrogenase family)